jgi:hypothetical protein
MKKKYKVRACKGLLSHRVRETIGTLDELAKEFSFYLGGVMPRKPETLEKRLNDSQRGHEYEYTYTVFFVEEVDD